MSFHIQVPFSRNQEVHLCLWPKAAACSASSTSAEVFVVMVLSPLPCVVVSDSLVPDDELLLLSGLPDPLLARLDSKYTSKLSAVAVG